MKFRTLLSTSAVMLCMAGCVTPPPAVDYSALQQSNPRSILVLPPTNHTSEVIAPYGVLAAVTQPLAESGYYVFPVALVDETFKNNGMTVAEDIHAIPLKKLQSIFGADAVLYIDVQQYGTNYVVLSSDTVVEVTATLKDLKTGALLWQGHARAASSERNDSNVGGGLVGMLVEAAVTQIIETSTDTSAQIAHTATQRLLSAGSYNGLLYGPRSPKHNKPAAKPTTQP